MTLDPLSPAEFLRAMFDVAVARADPMQVVPRHLPPRPSGRVVVIGAGKASARMAEAVESVWGPCEGLVITRYGYARPCKGIEIVEAAHPVPDQAGLDATARLLALLDGCGAEDTVLALVSGGGSALLVQPAGQITLAEKQALTRDLLACGAPIGTINAIRKQLSRVKGGRLAAAAWPARLIALMISDVPGDNPAEIASGPTVADRQSPQAALDALRHWGVTPAPSILEFLTAGGDPLSPEDPRLSHVENRIIAAPAQSLQAAAELARAQGCDVEILGDALEGEAREVARTHAALALARRPERPLVLLSGGELTVTRRGDGIGGPNAEYALALALALDGAAHVHAIACDTDGVDGAAEVAGAVIGPETCTDRAAAVAALARNVSHSFFAAQAAQVVPGPTLTNVNDFRAILILPGA